MHAPDHPTTRRALFAAGAALASAALPAAALATPPSGDDARFLAWEREAHRLWNQANERGLDDDDVVDGLVDDVHAIERMISQTKAEGFTPARVKAGVVARRLEHAEDDDLCLNAVNDIIAALRAAGAA